MAYTNDSIWKSIDKWTLCIYLALVIMGWFSICGASYDYGAPDFLNFDARAGKQLVWIACSLSIGGVIMMLDSKLYDTYAYLIYVLFLLVLFGTIFNPHEIKGSRSWIVLGPVSIQPAEFAKFATSLALAKYIGEYGFTMENRRKMITAFMIIFTPMILIVMQKETGSALVYLSFFLVMYREGLTGAVLFAGVCAVVFFIVGIRFSSELMGDGMTMWGEFAVYTLISLLACSLAKVYCKSTVWKVMLISCATVITVGALFSKYVIPFNVGYLVIGVCVVMFFYLIYMTVHQQLMNYLYIALFILGSSLFFVSTDYVFNDVLEPHQKVRIEVLLGMKQDLAGAGYNVNQSKIAIGSGGLLGKGFLNGTQTKLKYVPEQDTDFIFCTVGEEQGFLGSSIVLFTFTLLIIRLIYLSERQTSRFGRVYGYCVLSIFFFHLFINVGMVLGLTPVIGIPLPFFSYGGSSLWGFTILLFVFLRIDSARNLR